MSRVFALRHRAGWLAKHAQPQSQSPLFSASMLPRMPLQIGVLNAAACGQSGRFLTASSRCRLSSPTEVEPESEDKLENLKKLNPELYQKYKAKLEVADLSQFESKVDEPDVVDELLAPRLKEAARKTAEAKANDPTGKLMAENDSTIKPLGSILKLEKVVDLDVDQISVIWQEYHSETDSIGAVIPSEVYAKLKSRGMKNPFFAFPIPRDEGFEFFFGQFMGHQFAFTSMLEYQMHQDNARPYLLLNHYTELIDSKNVVLMSGELDENMNVLEATLLANQVQMFYLGDDAIFALVEDFNTRPQEFDYNRIITAIDTMGQKTDN